MLPINSLKLAKKLFHILHGSIVDAWDSTLLQF